MTTTDLHFEPPGPGSWDLDPVHFPRPATKYWSEMHPEAFARGFAEMTSFYGLPIKTRRLAYINGFMYGAAEMVQPEEFPQRLQRAEEVFEKKLWREQLREWNEECKPRSIERHRELQATDPDLLSDDELIDYLTRCRDHHAQMIAQHMRFTGAAVIPPGDLLVHVSEWTGLPHSQLLALMRGASPVSGGASEQLEHLVAALRADNVARQLLDSGEEPAKVLEELRTQDSEAGRAMADYLDFAGYRLLDGFDISGRYALEMPDVLLRAIRTSVQAAGPSDSGMDARVQAVRTQIPQQRQGEFDELLDEARRGYSVRDERGVFSDIWAAGLMRRAALAGGRRLAARGRLHDAEHFVHAGFDEMCAMLRGADQPTADALAERHQFHKAHTAKEAPPHLGPEEPPPPDPSALPPGAARLMRAMMLAMGAMFANAEAPHEADVIRGLSASGGSYEGPARRVAGPADFDRIVQGDVLLTESTTEAFNILLPLLGAIITDSGGALSHAAIVAREYGIPGVVGTRDATDRIPDGALVRVDGDSGRVTVLE